MAKEKKMGMGDSPDEKKKLDQVTAKANDNLSLHYKPRHKKDNNVTKKSQKDSK